MQSQIKRNLYVLFECNLQECEYSFKFEYPIREGNIEKTCLEIDEVRQSHRICDF